MTTRNKVLRILRGSAANRVNFIFSATTGINVVVNSTTYRRVADAIESGRISLREDRSLTDGMAEYLSTNRTDSNGHRISGVLKVPPIRGRVQEGFLIHEATHASFDLTHTNHLPVIDEEAACYIAEALFFRRVGLDRRRYRTEAWPGAIQVARSILRSRSINTSALNSLRAAIASDPTYNHNGAPGCYVSDG